MSGMMRHDGAWLRPTEPLHFQSWLTMRNCRRNAGLVPPLRRLWSLADTFLRKEERRVVEPVQNSRYLLRLDLGMHLEPVLDKVVVSRDHEGQV